MVRIAGSARLPDAFAHCHAFKTHPLDAVWVRMRTREYKQRRGGAHVIVRTQAADVLPIACRGLPKGQSCWMMASPALDNRREQAGRWGGGRQVCKRSGASAINKPTHTKCQEPKGGNKRGR